MSKNITIQEGGTVKTITVHKLKTTLVAGGTCLWVPEDEVSLGTKHITQNGIYTASEDGEYGYSQVTVNVPGGAGSATSSGTPTSNGGSTPGGIGSSIVGTDPTDGNEYGVGVDENGNLVTTKVPSAIAIGKAPDKIEYTDGETIDYGGIIVTLKGADGEPFSNADYPNGHVPINELIFHITVAEVDDENADIYTDGDGLNVLKCTFISHTGSDGNTYSHCNKFTGTHEGNPCTFGAVGDYNGRNMYLTVYKNNMYALLESGTGFYLYGFMSVNNRYVSFISIAVSAGINNWNRVNLGGLDEQSNVPVSTKQPSSEAMQNLHAKLSSIPVQWASPYDGRTFEDTFEITVTTPNNEGSGNEGGGGGGHSF